MKKKISKLTTNWFATPEGDEYNIYKIGKDDIVSIKEYCPYGQWYYDIEYSTGESIRVFNPNSVSYYKAKGVPCD